jgi:hypothetical protein
MEMDTAQLLVEVETVTAKLERYKLHRYWLNSGRTDLSWG